MKLRDAARCGKASEVMIERINAALEKLNAKERAVLTAIESLPGLNTSLEEAFKKWDGLIKELDEDGELDPNWISAAPSFDMGDLVDGIEGAFEDARSALSSDLEHYEESARLAAEYVEPEEEPEEEEEAEEFLFECDHPGCKVESSPENSDELAKGAARAAGWDVAGEKVFCPKHRSEG